MIADISLSGEEKNTKGSTPFADQVDKPPTPPVVQSTGVNEIEGVEKTDITTEVC